jgi:hypothetical protein
LALTRDFRKTVVARVERDPAFGRELLGEATALRAETVIWDRAFRSAAL